MVLYIPMAKKYPVVQIVGEKCMSMEPVVEKSEPLKIDGTTLIFAGPYMQKLPQNPQGIA